MQKIRIDFDNPGLPQHISAVENDSQSRFFQATLYENGKAYTAPEKATYSIMYRGFGPQNQGWYDTINDGAGKRAACAVSGNVVTCEIARQALQVPGHVSIVLCVTTGKGYMLKSWPIECDCKNDRYDSTAEIQSFFYITQVSNADWTQAIQAVEELKNTIDPTLSVSGKAADAAKVGEAVGEIKESFEEAYNMLRLTDWIAGKIIDDNGILVDSIDWCCTNQIKVKDETTYIYISGLYVGLARNTIPIVACYDNYSNYLGIAYTSTEDTSLFFLKVKLINNTAFVRLNGSKKLDYYLTCKLYFEPYNKRLEDFTKVVNKSSIDSNLTLKDSAFSKIVGFTLYGESVQNGIPSQASNIPITSVGEKGNVNIGISSKTGSYTVSIPLNEPLRSVGNVKDTLEYNSNGSGKITRRVFYKVFKGTGEYWGKRYDITDVSAFVLISYKAGLLKNASIPLSSHFTGVGDATGDVGTIQIIDSDGYGFQFNVDKTKFADVDAWKNWLSKNNVTVLAEINTPKTEELTKEQVEKFNEICMYDDNTSIKTDYDSDVSVEYIANTKKYIDSKEMHKNILFFDDFESFNDDVWKSCELPKASSENVNAYRITENNLFIENSILTLKCCKDSNGEYAAPYITTADNFAFQKGKISAKIKFGDYDTTLFTDGGGFWTFGQGGDWANPFEFDIIELIYGKPPMYTVHYKSNGRDTKRNFVVDVDVTKWHIYSLEITDNYVIYYIDNKIVSKYRISGFNADGKINPQDIRLAVKMNLKSAKKDLYMFVDWIKIEDDEYIPTENITHQNINLNINDVYVVDPTFYPANASNRSFTMESSDNNIVSIHKYENDVEYSFVANKIKALQSGTAKITLKTSKGYICGEFTVTVN